MKKSLLLVFLGALFCVSTNAQINKLGSPSTVGWSAGWYPENSNDPFTLTTEGTAIKVTPITSPMTSKFQQRFAPSVNGEYTLKFKAKADIPGQKIKFNILRCDAWSGLADQSEVTIASSEYQDYVVTFNNYNQNVKEKTASTYQLEVYVNGVSGAIWLDQIMLTENSDVLTVYEDDFETDQYFGMYGTNINSWLVGTWNEQSLPSVSKDIVNGTTVMRLIQNPTLWDQTFDATINRIWWAAKDVQYRVKFDASASVDANTVLRVWFPNSHDLILPDTEFAVGATSQTYNYVTNATAHAESYRMSFFIGKFPANEKLYIDNVLISPIYLYDVKVQASNQLVISWKHSGYLAGDKLTVKLIEAGTSNIQVIADDVEVVDGSITITNSSINQMAPLAIDEEKTYYIEITDKVSEVNPVNNTSTSENFDYSITSIDDAETDNIKVYGLNGFLCFENAEKVLSAKVYSMDGKLVETLNSGMLGNSVVLNKGIYIVQLYTQTGISVYKVVV